MSTGDRANDQVESLVKQSSKSLQQLESLLTSESVDEEILTEFRDAVNRIRITGWMVEKMRAKEGGATPNQLLAQERIRCITRMSEQLTEFLAEEEDCNILEGFETLRDSLEELMAAVRVHLLKSGSEM